ncbi:HNH endonuclease [Candidatus Pacearchaeota archaeon]|nr:HNH endonuclease [Candidatus Pacearchaeota archaeon]
MALKRDQTLRKKVFERDKFTCKKCGLVDKQMKELEVHHIVPLCFDGKDELENLIALCSDCHHYAPNSREEFEVYLREEMDGTMTTLIAAWNKVRKEKPELFNKVQEKLRN